MPASMTVFVPKDLVLDPRKLARAVSNGLDAAQKGAAIDFEVTVSTWQHKPDFEQRKPNEATRTVETDDEIYGYVSGGTKPHVIVAHGKALVFPSGGFRPKSRPGYIGANQGSKGKGVVFRKMVSHPGSKARDFDKAIAKKWQEQLPIEMQRAIDSEV
jgi:hypothetical protein